ncbi:azurin [Salinimicrobium sediminilitoris]|uniref:azurin n=1 Tax=Salinimicrobium sediminilitoris TaxID=2876715 RepID=UPI001E39A2FA|nr:azurin [Salinimicrobium sediminilitoris]MCC8358336.1 azurin [Salinimicrobium sediminilitoris]
MNTLVTFSAAIILAFNGFTSEESTEKNPVVSTEIEQPVRTIVINSNDQMRFDTNEIKVKAGEKIKLTLNHTGKMAKNVMGHNFVLLTKGTDVNKFGRAAMDEKENEYIPSTGVIAHTKLIGGGESTTIEFTAPAKETYDFVCSFPGHYSIMKGKFIVE